MPIFFSTHRPVNAGLSQNSKLGPWLYKTHISDIPTSPRTLLAIFADRTTVMIRDKDCLIVHDHLQLHIRKLETVFPKRNIKINLIKSQAVIFSRNRSTLLSPTLS